MKFLLAAALTRRRGGRNGWRAQVACRAALLVGSAIASSLVGCTAQTEPRPNFVVVVVDTLRADAMSYAGHSRATPHFDALQQRSAWFPNAYANAPWTLPSLASLFTSQICSRHKVVIWGNELSADHLTLPEVLQAAGYRTGAFMSNVLFGPDSGFGQGFDDYDVVVSPAALVRKPGEPFPNAPASLVTKRGMSWLQQLRVDEPDTPFFLYLHYMEPHTPYRCPAGAAGGCTPRAADINERLHAEDWEFDDDERETIVRLYDSEVTRMDGALGRLLAALEQSHGRDNTWLVVTSDHGEQLGERGVYLHGKSLDRREIRVPLLIQAPDGRASVTEEPVALIDVAPTLLDLAGVAAPASFGGRSLVAALAGNELEPAPVVSEIFQTTKNPPRHRLAVINANEKIVLSPGGETSRFDLRRDPNEAEPLPAAREDLWRALGPFADAIDLDGVPEDPEIDAETRERLRALGYDWQ
jgi:arylsulfatase A-like enzyme